ncbi:alkaline phosphatase [Salinisphaera sp. T5B8]|uniref:alkaline phosphatase D family protein n=1 Tax=Salinisphaera sp. T5B8 TaxID=1304154 RepID=UPI00334042BE
MDDHESTNDSWRGGAQNHDPDRGEGPWSKREAVSIQAYYEWLPIRETEPDNRERIYRGFEIGDLVSLSMLDTRLIGRDQQLENNAEQGFTDTGDYANADRTLIDDNQRQWLADRLEQSPAIWKLIGQQVMFGQLKSVGAPNASNATNPGGQGGVFFNSDQWDGYPRARERVWEIIRGGQAAPNVAIDNVVVLTGDIHTSWAMDITEDPNNAAAYDPATGLGSMGVEFVATSVTSPGFDSNDLRDTILSQNPHMKYAELTQRGYLLLDITRERMQAEWWYVDDIKSRNNQQRFASAWQVRAGENHVVAASGQSQPVADAPTLAPQDPQAAVATG